MVTRAQIEKDIDTLVGIAYKHLPWTADRFFSAIRECADRLDDALGSLPDICQVQASAMTRAAREIGLSDQEICTMALAVQREARCGVSTAPAPVEESSPNHQYMEFCDEYGHPYPQQI